MATYTLVISRYCRSFDNVRDHFVRDRGSFVVARFPRLERAHPRSFSFVSRLLFSCGLRGRDATPVKSRMHIRAHRPLRRRLQMRDGCRVREVNSSRSARYTRFVNQRFAAARRRTPNGFLSFPSRASLFLPFCSCRSAIGRNSGEFVFGCRREFDVASRQRRKRDSDGDSRECETRR